MFFKGRPNLCGFPRAADFEIPEFKLNDEMDNFKEAFPW
jgi:hypothetical protein